MKSGVYTITNVVNGKLYVGMATNIETRLNGHKCDLRKRTHGNAHLQKAWNKYGKENFLFEVLVYCEKEYLRSEEHYWCLMLNTHDRMYGYNIQPTTPEGNWGVSEETKKKISKIHTGRPSPFKNTKRERYIVDKIQISNRGKVRSAEMRQRIKEWQSVAILQYHKDTGQFIKEWASIKEAEEELQINGISGIICGKNIWRKDWHFRRKIGNEIPLVVEIPKPKQVDVETRKRVASIGGRNNNSNIPVIMLTVDGLYVNEYRSANEASMQTGVDASAISKLMRGIGYSAAGYIFMAKKDYDPNMQYKKKEYKIKYNTPSNGIRKSQR